jgi:hypothetical protein
MYIGGYSSLEAGQKDVAQGKVSGVSTGHRAEGMEQRFKRQRSEVRSQRSEVRGQRSEVRK